LKATKVRWTETCHEDREGRKVGEAKSIPLENVLAVAWNPGRLEQCRRQLAERTTPPRIVVVGLRREGHPTLYAVGDGMHRTVAAKELGKKTIRANVEGFYDCDPARFILCRNTLWDTQPENPASPGSYRSVTHTHRMPQETLDALTDIGVRLIPDDQSAFS